MTHETQHKQAMRAAWEAAQLSALRQFYSAPGGAVPETFDEWYARRYSGPLTLRGKPYARTVYGTGGIHD